jgi:ankyrin repeat protein
MTPEIDPMRALTRAVKANDAAEVGRLLQQHPELKSTINDPLPDYYFGGTALIGASTHGNREMIDLLLRAGADINQKSHWWAGGFCALDNAYRDPALAQFLIERGAVADAPTAAGLGLFDTLKALISANPDAVHARGGDGQMALHRARTVEAAQYLLDHGAEIDARDVDHESTPAQYLVRDHQDVARYLVSRGAKTDILMAAALGDLARVRTHLDADPASIRTSVSEEYFPKQNPNAGGSIYIWTLGSNKTAHVVAREFGHEESFRLLMDRSPAELQLATACEIGDEPLVKRVLASHPNAAQTLTRDDHRKLANAAQDNNITAVRLMLAAGWPPDSRGQHGGTALHWAAWLGNADMVREILRHNPTVDLKDNDYNASALGWAVHASLHGWHPDRGDYAATVEALLQAGAQPPEATKNFDASDAVRATLHRHAARS